jgi:uncharacterized protein YbcC (UPF0753/DUF2309 family)
MHRVNHDGMLMDADYFQQQLLVGRVRLGDLEEAVRLSGSEITASALLGWLSLRANHGPAQLRCVSDLAGKQSAWDWNSVITEEISKWCAAYFDEGQAAWRMPWKKLPLFTAWRQAAMIDATPEMLGLQKFRELVTKLPDTAEESLPVILETLQISSGFTEDYLHRLLMTLPGWASYVQYKVRDKAMHGTHDEGLLELLTVRLVFELALLKQFEDCGLEKLWLVSQVAYQASPPETSNMEKQLLWHLALELGFQRVLSQRLSASVSGIKASRTTKPAVQAVFCIDVRSEVMRRHLEAQSEKIETLGFAGFFGMPIEYVPLGQRHGTAQVPVLFSPKYRVREHQPHCDEAKEKSTRRKRQVGRRLSHSWNAFKTSAVSCFSFVEAAGISSAWHLIRESLQLQPMSGPGCCHGRHKTAPNLHEHKPLKQDALGESQVEVGIPLEDQVQLALGALKNMGITQRFAQVVLLCGHGSNTRNNPYSASLDCGACGGHSGHVNARVAAAILNQPHVRAALVQHGISIPVDTYFIAAVHDTTTDDVTMFDVDELPSSHRDHVIQLTEWLDQASSLTRKQRGLNLGIVEHAPEAIKQAVHSRSRDWSQVRPEWGLAGNAAFVVAPRERTLGIDLGGRVFLHNYNAEHDADRSVLEMIMTGPMIVTNWINMQYYASTVNHRLWGSGTKVTHNVVGTIGIQQGNGGDLRTGLPFQSVHNGDTWVHEPLRLSIFIEAPKDDILALLEKNPSVQQLAANQWIHLFAIEPQGREIHRFHPSGTWLPVGKKEKQEAAPLV